MEPCWKSRWTLPKMGGSSALPPLSGDVWFLFRGQGWLTYAPHWWHMLSRKGTICALQPCKRWDSQAAAGLGAQKKPGARILPPANDRTCTLWDSGSQCPGPVELRSYQVPAEQETASSLSLLPSFSPFDDGTEMLVDWDRYTHASLKQPCSGTDDSSWWQCECDCRLIHLVLTHESHLWNPGIACTHSCYTSLHSQHSVRPTQQRSTQKKLPHFW